MSAFEALLEPIERRMYVDLYTALPETVARDCGIAWRLEGGALRLTCRSADHPFFNRTMGLVGAAEEVDAWLDELVEHYRDHGIQRWMLQVPPAQQSGELARRLSARGLVQLRGWSKHAGRVGEVRSAVGNRQCPLRIERIGGERAADFASILAPAFQFPTAASSWPAATVGRPGWNHYLAYDGDEPVACAAMFLTERVATLTFAVTRESHRRRGAQSALIARRLHDASRLGAEWLATETDEDLPERPNPSHRNVERMQMPVRYVRANWGPPPPVEGRP